MTHKTNWMTGFTFGNKAYKDKGLADYYSYEAECKEKARRKKKKWGRVL